MAFQDIKSIQSSEFYLDVAFKRANKKAAEKRAKTRRKSQIEKVKYLELIKIDIIQEILSAKCDNILNDFPNTEELPVFYKELIKVTIDVYSLKKALSNIYWIKNKVKDFSKIYKSKISKSHDLAFFHRIKKEFYGRISSLFKRAKDNFIFLENTRKTLRQFPVIKTKLKTIAIAGFPNVGKSTLLGKLSSSKPEVAAYAFTTKGIMIGYCDKIQLLDTPGTLNRLDKMNMIEKQAWLALKYLAEKIIYVFDLTEPFPLLDQEKLYKKIKQFEKPVIIYLSKTDILEKEKIDKFKKKYKIVTDINELKKLI
jgi:nucleolar GTP-binding protein